jgi:lysophospholipid acyltransferase (LPLAT)-like uncharacterized protein
MKFFKKKFRNIQKLPTWIFLPPALLLKFMKTFMLRTEYIDPNNLIQEAEGCISVTWHNRLLYFPTIFPAAVRKKTMAVVSPSRDGQYIVDLISHFGISSLRGSSSKKGAKAQRAAFKALDNGYNVSFTPDGPRGPKYKMSRGPIHLASKTGRKIIPVTINASRYWSLKSWDGFQIAKPFAKLTLIMGDAIEVPPDLDNEGLEKWRKIVEDRLMDITQD